MVNRISIPLIIFSLIILADATKAGSAMIASWYGGGEVLNKYTANGEVFDAGGLTCASWDYPFNTRLKVTNLANGKSITVRVNDRGPNKELGRVIDLSKYAFSKIAELKEGLIFVTIEKVGEV